MKNFVVFGAHGGLGKQVCRLLESGYNLIPIGSDDVDVTKYEEVEAFFVKIM